MILILQGGTLLNVLKELTVDKYFVPHCMYVEETTVALKAAFHVYTAEAIQSRWSDNTSKQ